MAKEGTISPSRPRSVLSDDAPQVRTAEAVIRKYEQIEYALETGAITPKQGEQLGQPLKGITGLAKLELQFRTFLQKSGRTVPVVRNALLRSVIGLQEHVSPDDGEKVRALIGEK